MIKVNDARAGGSAGQASTFDGARGGVTRALSSGRQQMQSHPFAAMAAAGAVGAGIGWLLPASRREAEVMADVAHKVTDAARDAANTAVEAGRQQVDDITKNALASVGGAVVQALVSGEQPAKP